MNDLNFVTELLVDGSRRGVTMHSDHLNSFNAKSSVELTKLREIISTEHITFKFRKIDYIFQPFNKQLKKLIETGIVSYVINQFKEIPKEFSQNGPEILSLDHLRIGFEIWLFFLMCAFAIFIIECLIGFAKSFISIMLWRNSIEIVSVFSSALFDYRR